MINDIINAYSYSLGHDVGSVGEILSVLLAIFLMSLYVFVVYRVVSHRSMYNKAFHTSIMIIPFFIGAIVMALQSNLVITLGTIGALAIIRYRTAVKDPVDMLYILWCVFIGITCGCQLYELCVLTSLVATIVLIMINILSGRLLNNPFILVINCDSNIENQIVVVIKNYSKYYKLKSRNYCQNEVDFIFQIETKDPNSLIDDINHIKGVNKSSLLEFDNEDVI